MRLTLCPGGWHLSGKRLVEEVVGDQCQQTQVQLFGMWHLAFGIWSVVSGQWTVDCGQIT